MSQEDLAERSGLSSQAIGALERGDRRHPYPSTVRALAEALNLPAALRADLLALASRRRVSPEPPPLQAGATEFPPPAGALPVPLTPLLGREGAVVAAIDLLHTNRLLTVIGPGGVGKTRLAIQIASQIGPHFQDSAVFVPLAPLADPILVLPALAQALGILDTGPGTVAETLRHALRDRHLVIVLDNCEHVLNGAADAAALLQSCPGLVILATSRSPLRVRGEQEYPLPPLSVPPRDRAVSVYEAGEFSAVRLFVERARAANPALSLAPENVEAVVEICRRLDGLPLAIELVAPRVKILPPQALLQRLSYRLGTIGGGRADLPTRQQTFRNVVDWSYSLLSTEDQALFARISVFSGSFSLEDAEAVCGDHDVLEGLASLLDQSLLVGTGSEAPRFHQLETIREFGAEKLAERGEAEEGGAAHAAYFLQVALDGGRELHGPHAGSQVARLEAALENIRAALRWFLDHGRTSEALRLATALQPYWRTRGLWTEAQHWLEEGLARDGAGTAERSAALLVLGALLSLKCECGRAVDVLESAVTAMKELNDPGGTAEALGYLSLTAFWQGDYERTAGYLQESEQLRTALGDPGRDAGFLGILGTVALEQGRLGRAREQLAEAVRLARETGVPDRLALELSFLGYLSWHEGNLAEAESFCSEAQALSRATNAKRPLSYALLGAGLTALARGRLEEAGAYLDESLRLAWELGYLYCALSDLTALASLALAQGEPERAARLSGAEETLRSASCVPLPPSLRRVHEDTLSSSARLGDEAYARARAAGAAMSLQDAVAYALDEDVQSLFVPQVTGTTG